MIEALGEPSSIQLTFFEGQVIDVERIGQEKRLLFADCKELLAAKVGCERQPSQRLPRALNTDLPESDDNLRYFEAPMFVLEHDPNRRSS